MFGLGVPEMLMIGGVLLLVFGPSRIPQVAASLGKGLREFKRGIKGFEEELQAAGELPPARSEAKDAQP